MKKGKKSQSLWMLLPIMASWLLFVTSCSKATYLKVDKDSIQTTISGTSGDIAIETDGNSVQVEHAPQWIKTEINEEHTSLHYEVTLNSDRQLREDSIVLKSSDQKCVISVRQTFHATYIKTNPTEVTIPQTGGQAEVDVEMDSESPLVVDNTTIASVQDNKVVITLPENRGRRDLEQKLKISCDEESAEVIITQESNACKTCGGSGHLNKPCLNCNGMGAHICCNYTGKQFCPSCGGSGLSR